MTYGWEGLRTWDTSPAWQERCDQVEAEVKGRFAGYDVTFKGRLSKPDLASVLMESDVCLYPCNFFETFCLTALECQAAGVPVVTSEFGALATTLAPGAGVKIPGIRIRRHIVSSSCGRRWTCCRTLSGGGPWVRPAWCTWPAGRSVGWTWRNSGGGWSGVLSMPVIKQLVTGVWRSGVYLTR